MSGEERVGVVKDYRGQKKEGKMEEERKRREKERKKEKEKRTLGRQNV